MKKNQLMLLILIALLIATAPVSALNSPQVGSNQGVVTVFFVSPTVFAFGFEYGFNDNFALCIDYITPFSRLGIKYQLLQTTALLGGINLTGQTYLGLNFSNWLTANLELILEANVLVQKKIVFPYELGVRAVIGNNLDFRGGFFGNIAFDQLQMPKLKVGLGYNF